MSDINVEISHTNSYPKKLSKDHTQIRLVHIYRKGLHKMSLCMGFRDKYQFYMWFLDRKLTTAYCHFKHEEWHFLDFNQILNVQQRMFDVFGCEYAKALFHGYYVMNHRNKFTIKHHWSCNKALYVHKIENEIDESVYICMMNFFKCIWMHLRPYINSTDCAVFHTALSTFKIKVSICQYWINCKSHFINEYGYLVLLNLKLLSGFEYRVIS